MSENDTATENIYATLKYYSSRAYFIELEDGRHRWVPESLVHNTIDHSNCEDQQYFTIEWWFVEKYELY